MIFLFWLSLRMKVKIGNGNMFLLLLFCIKSHFNHDFRSSNCKSNKFYFIGYWKKTDVLVCVGSGYARDIVSVSSLYTHHTERFDRVFVYFVLFYLLFTLIFIRLHMLTRHSLNSLSPSPFSSITYFPFQSIRILNLFIVISRIVDAQTIFLFSFHL